MAMGAEALDGGIACRVWAPAAEKVELHVEGKPRIPLRRDRDGWHSGFTPGVGAGSRYGFALDGGPPRPDPASRFQPDGPHGLSMLIDPDSYPWQDSSWAGPRLNGGLVLYELHVGTFTPEGRWGAAAAQLEGLAALGIAVVEVMPVADFPGAFGWGYDGVNLFAPSRLYGTPDEMRAFVDRAHGVGLGVILDVVYNHLGPSGNYLREFSSHYFSAEHETEWGQAINFDGPDAGPVRDYFVANACYWIREFHLDGLRLDATQSIFDRAEGRPHILAEVTKAARAAAGPRPILIVGENEPQSAFLLAPLDEGGCGLDALWNDDLHHSSVVALTGRREAYFTDYGGSVRELAAATNHGFLYQGQRYRWQGAGRGTPVLDFGPERFVTFLENHDQVANTGMGTRLREQTSADAWRAMTAFLLLGPGVPMLFQGQEHGSTRPFCFFADHEAELARLIEIGRRSFLAQFPSLATAAMQERLPPPQAPATFESSRLDPRERAAGGEALALHRDLIALRRRILEKPPRPAVIATAFERDILLLRYRAADGDDYLLTVNLGAQHRPEIVPEPLLAPPMGRDWAMIWSSGDPRYGGSGAPSPILDGEWSFAARSATLLHAISKDAE